MATNLDALIVRLMAKADNKYETSRDTESLIIKLPQAAQNDRAAAEREIDQLKIVNSNLHAALESLRRGSAKKPAQALSSNLSGDLHKMKAQVAKLTTDLQKSKAVRTNQTNELGNLHKINRDLKSTNANLRCQLDTAAGPCEVQKLKSANGNLKFELKKLRKEYNDLKGSEDVNQVTASATAASPASVWQSDRSIVGYRPGNATALDPRLQGYQPGNATALHSRLQVQSPLAQSPFAHAPFAQPAFAQSHFAPSSKHAATEDTGEQITKKTKVEESSPSLLKRLFGGLWSNQDKACENGRRLYIGNLAHATTEGELKEFFKDYLVETILIPTNPHTTCPVVRYAFVTVSSPSEAECAINELNGKSIMGRKVSVQLARRPEPAAATKESFGVPVDHANAATGQHDFATDVAALTGNWQRTDTSTEQAKRTYHGHLDEGSWEIKTEPSDVEASRLWPPALLQCEESGEE